VSRTFLTEMRDNPRMLRKTTLLAALLFSLSLSAQLVETIEVRVTNIDVVVTDSKGQPVTGLTKDDFVVTEGGKEQPISNFYEIRGTAAPAAGGAVTAEVPEVPESISRRRVVVFVDNFTINPLSRNRAFDALEKAMNEIIRDGDEAMIVLWNRRLQLVTPFTSDRAELVRQFRQAAKESSGGISLEMNRTRILSHAQQMIQDAIAPGQNKISIPRAYAESISSAQQFAEEIYAIESAMLDDLDRTIDTLAGVDGKKALIFLGAELPENPGRDLLQQLDGMFSTHMRIDRPSFLQRSGNLSLGTAMRKVAHQANANGVTMYLVDTVDRQRRSDPTEGMVDAAADFFSQTNTPVSMSMIASITGGISVAGGKSFEKALGTIAHDLSSYYSIGYRSPSEGAGSRDVKVHVKRPGLRIRSRGSYIAKSPEEDLRERVIANVFHANVKSDFAISVKPGTPERQPDGQFRLPLTITLPSSMTLIPQDNQLKGEFAVYIAVGNPAGTISDVTKNVQAMQFPAGSEEQIRQMGTFTYQAALLVGEGSQIISVAVVDAVAGSAGFARETIVAQ
jgi:VWFA-related protein